jgi:two-component system, response regulator, stage 0 sporulation protein F
MATTTEQIEKRPDDDQKILQSNAKILLVDDEMGICSLYSKIIEKYGYTNTRSVYDGTDAVKAFELDPNAADVVVLDYRMRLMNGTEAARRIRQINPKIRMIMVTAYQDLNETDRAFFESVLNKPISSKQLCSAIDQSLQNL